MGEQLTLWAVAGLLLAAIVFTAMEFGKARDKAVENEPGEQIWVCRFKETDGVLEKTLTCDLVSGREAPPLEGAVEERNME
jgi:hypothetical protein